MTSKDVREHETISAEKALSIAEALFNAHYSEASFAYAAGSIMRGEGTHLSDIDFVVVYDHLEAACRESLVYKGVPVEVFNHDPETLGWFINDDIERGQPGLLSMVAEGVIIGDRRPLAEQLQSEARARLEQGPPPLSTEALNALRYEITDALDDLQGDRPHAETLAIGAVLYPKLAELALRGRHQWNGATKWLPRLLTNVDAELANEFDTSFRTLFTTGAVGPVVALIEEELSRQGGRYFDGDRRLAPASWRIAR